MDPLTYARDLYRQGRFSEASERLKNVRSGRFDIQTLLLKASVSEHIGELQTAEAIARQILKSRGAQDPARASAEFILSRVACSRGDVERELAHLQKSRVLAERVKDAEQLGWTEVRLLALTSDRTGVDASRQLMSSVRRHVSCAGNPTLSAMLHLIVADADGKRGLLAKSEKHVKLAQSILSRYSNTWLEGWAEGTLLALAMVRCDLPSARLHGRRAMRLAEESGARTVIRLALGNVGRLHYMLGEYSRALEYLNSAVDACQADGYQADGLIESIARIYMAQGRLEESAELMRRFEIGDRTALTNGGYVHRHSLLTKAEILARCGDSAGATAHLREAEALARQAEDSILEDSCRLLATEGCGLASHASATAAVAPPRQATPEISVLYERALTAQLVRSGQLTAALAHRDRAVRICHAVSNRPAETGVWWAWESLVGETPETTAADGLAAARVIQEIASLLVHAGRPELIATSVMAILQHAGCVLGVRAVARATDTAEEELGAWGTLASAEAVRTIAVGTSRERLVELQVQPLPDIESQATVDAAGSIIAIGQEIERARLEREERLTLWPVDELPAEDDDSVVAGKMREVMLSARKIAETNVTVLVTGESGTGKEVVARAIHRYSTRARKPFVPFNCTAVPRELIESHLFGFKRGAFTGADRDNPGIIRAAKDGTLFLDEIGELSLDLQPKLLRFLESGEINPLGEATPLSVNVRIVAATNRNLKKLVEDGLFREDLYYRLNVIPIELPPLRERREEIEPLAQHFALKWSHDLGKGRIRVAPDLMAHLVLYPWPGNIRQLSNEINRMVAMAEPDAPLTLEHFPRSMREETEMLKRRASGLEIAVSLTDRLDQAVSLVEREMIAVALREHGGKVEAAAKALGISRKGLYLKRQRLGL